ncbi:riboflavin kinase isoform X2 [Copidosoma floridanum]|uniref:riboflavin kinase isoform X2 n=1 Tax=Copidosoma floridanum TaxID=29053 RepID=UPI0006C9546E|nr:riboflavin kinase isoform X2 [Copidosoma floridanum]
MRKFCWRLLLWPIRICDFGADANNFNAGCRTYGKLITDAEKNLISKKNKTVSMLHKKYLPYYAAGEVVSGFGRGSKSLGCPTANFSEEVVEALPAEFETGVYYGWAWLEKQIYKMVMSIGWNPFYKNDKKSMEIHLIHKFDNDFYGKELKIIILGFIRPEMDFKSVDDLIKEIQSDIEIAKKSLDHPSMVEYKSDPFFHS